MADIFTLFWLALLSLVQPWWCVYYARTYDWRSTPLGPVWLMKGSALAVLWPLLLVNQFVDIPSWVWGFAIGPFVTAGTVAWLVATIRTARASRVTPPQP